MKNLKRLLVVTILFSLVMSFNAFAMVEGLGNIFMFYGHDSNARGFCDNEGNLAKDCWAWINEKCYHFNSDSELDRQCSVNGYNIGYSGEWVDSNGNPVERTVFTGKWNTLPDENKTFTYDDGTVALGYQKIDDKWYYFKASGVLALNYKAQFGTTDGNGVMGEPTWDDSRYETLSKECKEIVDKTPNCTSHE